MADELPRSAAPKNSVTVAPTPKALVEHRALAILALLAAGSLLVVAMPIGTGLFLGALTAFTLLPLHEKLVERVRRRWLASLICAVCTWIAVVGSLAAIVTLLIVRGATLAQTFQHASQGGGFLNRIEETLARPLAPLGVKPEDMTSHFQSGAEAIASKSAAILADAGIISIKILLGVGFLVLTVFFMLEKWPGMVAGLKDVLPLKPDHTKKLLDSLRAVGRQTIIGTLGVGLTQAALATLAYLICGAPDPGFYGAMTAVASLVPGVGTMIVWVPMGIYLIATGHAAGGIALLLIGSFVVVGFCDAFLRPKLTGGDGDAGFFPTLIGLFGGIEVFGVMGLVVGPTLVGFAIAILKLYIDERKASATTTLASAPTTGI
ncbi:MAG: AI-2E family transporter [Polyangiaceae bacterium]